MHRHTHFCVEVRTFTYHPNAYLSPAFYLCFSCFLLSHVLFLVFLDLPSIRNALSFLTSSAGFQSRSANFYSPHKSSISVRLFSVSPAFLFDSALYCLISCRGQFFQMFQLFTFFFFYHYLSQTVSISYCLALFWLSESHLANTGNIKKTRRYSLSTER